MHVFNKKYLHIQGLNFTQRGCSMRFHFERWSKVMALSLSSAPAPHRWWVHTWNKVLTFHYCHKMSCRTTLSSSVLLKNISSGSWKKIKRKENSHPCVINEPADLVNSLPGAFLPKDLLHLLPFVLKNFVISTLSLKYLAQTQKENLGIF